MTDNQNTSKGLDRQCQCMFCGEHFTAKQIEFCVPAPNSGDYYDQEFENHIRQYKGSEDKEAPYRVWLDWSDSTENVMMWEDGDIPAKVHGTLRNVTASQAEEFGFGFNLFGNSDKEEMEEEVTKDGDKIWRNSSIRVCPFCHMTLPTGFMSDNKIRVGIVGGKRSGKTTYMVVVSKYLQQRFTSMGHGVGLGNTTFVPECEEYIEALYKSDIGATNYDPDLLEKDDSPVLPVIIRITPSEKGYEPFFLILQDIPGEYMSPEPLFREMLMQSNIRESTDILMMVDVNHFVKTRQQAESERYGEFCKAEINRLFDNYENLGACLNAQTAHNITSIQVVLTKLDFWIEAEPRLTAASFSKNCDDKHKSIISEKRLNQVDQQLRSVLNQLYGYADMVDVMEKRLGLKVPPVKKAYTAIASRSVPEHEEYFKTGFDVDYVYSVNVLEPLLNIFASHGVLPVREEDIAAELIAES